jgi:transposase
MGHRAGQSREQAALFPLLLDEMVGPDRLVRVVDAWVQSLDVAALGFEKAVALRRGAPPYDPADLLALYLWGYLNGVRSSRKLQQACQCNVECMWLLGRLAPDFKTIAEFRRRNTPGLIAVCASFVNFACSKGLIKGTMVAIDGTKIKAVASRKAIVSAAELAKRAKRNADEIAQYLQALDAQDEREAGSDVRDADVRDALAQLHEQREQIKQQVEQLAGVPGNSLVHTEPEARPMKSLHGAPGYNLQTAVDTESHLIVHYDVSADANDLRQLQPMSQAAAKVLPQLEAVLADSGYDNGEQIAVLGKQNLTTFVAPKGAVNPLGLLDRDAFRFDAENNQYTCPAGKILKRKKLAADTNRVIYMAKAGECGACPMKADCTSAARRSVSRHAYQDALDSNAQRVQANPQIMKLRRQTVEHPFGTMKDQIMGNARLLMRGLLGAKGELSLAVLACNMKRVFNLKGSTWMHQALQG